MPILTGRARPGWVPKPRSRFARHGLSIVAGVGALLGLVACLLPFYAAVPRSGPSGVGDRAHGIVFSRHRQAQFEAVTDDRPLPRPFASALPSARVPRIVAPTVTDCSSVGDGGPERASRRVSPGHLRSPPVS